MTTPKKKVSAIMTNTRSRPTNLTGLDGRLSALESDVKNLAQIIHQLADDVRRKQFPLQAIIGICAILLTLVLAIGGAFGSGYIRDQARLEDKVVRMSNEDRTMLADNAQAKKDIELFSKLLPDFDKRIRDLEINLGQGERFTFRHYEEIVKPQLQELKNDVRVAKEKLMLDTKENK